MPKDVQLLTVSKETSAGGKYRSIKEALKDAKPWATIRVLDAAAYAETVVLDKPRQQEGICLEAIKQATLVLEAGSQRALVIDNVPNVRVSGFRFRQTGAAAALGNAFVALQSHVPGFVLQECDLEGSRTVDGVRIHNLRASVGEDPVVIARCTIYDVFLAIRVQGPLVAESSQLPLRGLVIRDNRVARAMGGIVLIGAVADTHVMGNLIWDCQQMALQIQDLGPGSKHILFANNDNSR